MRNRTRRFLIVMALVGLWLAGTAHGGGAGELVLDLDTLTADLDGTTLQATEVAGAYVGPIDDEVFGIARFGEVAPQPFTATWAAGDAGLYRAQAQVGGIARTAGWVVLEDGRQRGSLDGKGNDVYPPPALR